MKVKDLKLIVFPNIIELGNEVNEHLKKITGVDEDFFVQFDNPKFASGEGKVKIYDTLRDSDVYILSDVGNYNIPYTYRGRTQYLTPVEHFAEIKSLLSAISGHAQRINVVTPLLYAARQHRRKGRESLDCAIALQELEHSKVNNIITFDAHDPNIVNAIPNLPFENVYPTNEILLELINNEIHNQDELNNILVVAPDFGASERARYYSEILGCDMGAFYKRRDVSVIVNGSNPVVEHIFLGPDVKGKDIIVVDDMISSGKSMLEVCEELKHRGASKIFLAATFPLMTDGYDTFEDYYRKGLLNGLYSTNLTYVPDIANNYEWYHTVNCSRLVANIINSLNRSESLEIYQNTKSSVLSKVKSLKG